MWKCDAGTFPTLKEAFDATAKRMDDGLGFEQIDDTTGVPKISHVEEPRYLFFQKGVQCGNTARIARYVQETLKEKPGILLVTSANKMSNLRSVIGHMYPTDEMEPYEPLPKLLRPREDFYGNRRGTPWVSPDISHLWENLEAYYCSQLKSTGVQAALAGRESYENYKKFVSDWQGAPWEVGVDINKREEPVVNHPHRSKKYKRKNKLAKIARRQNRRK